MKRAILFITTVVAALTMTAQTTFVKNHQVKGRIIYSDTRDLEAATMLQDFTERISGAKPQIVMNEPGVKVKKGDVVIKRSDNPEIKDDGFRLDSRPGYLTIESNKGKGALYGVVTLLEQYLGCNYWGENEYTIPRRATIEFPYVVKVDNPAFTFRSNGSYAMTDPYYRIWARHEDPNELFAGGYWVHTFNRLLPAAKYGKEHPEYYALFDGVRHPGQAGQWCLSNDEVFEIVCHEIDSIFKANPGLDMISVSQNDGNYTNCKCDNCSRIDSIEGGPSGSLIHFLNRIADRFPDKQISTLAYLYTMNPPKHVKPRKNVNIMLCNIDCYREVPMQYNASGRQYLKALDGWSEMSENFFLWDYGINCDGFATPFPNYHIMQPNIRTFRDHNAKMLFNCNGNVRGGDMTELRCFLVDKLMWNPDADVDSLTNTFLNGYYGEAGPYIGEYLKLMEGALLGSGIPLWIYDSPATHKDGMLNAMLRGRYNVLFDKAENAVRGDSALLARVQRSRLSLQYSELEIERTMPDKDIAKLKEMLDTFDVRAARYGLASINERSNSPHDYVTLYRSRYLPREQKNLAAGCEISFSSPLPAPYDKLGGASLTDGLFGGMSYKDSWIGWEGIDVDITVDLGKPTEIRSIDTDFLHQIGAWILQPKSVTYSLSDDGKSWQTFPRHELVDDQDGMVKFVGVKENLATPQTTRYVKISVEGMKKCPEWHYGVGNPCWFFLDEITIN